MTWNLFGVHVPVWLYAPVFLGVWLVVGLMVRALLAALVGTTSRLLKVLVHAFSLPVLLLTFISGPIALLAWSPLGDSLRHRLNLNIALALCAVFLVILFVDRLLRGLIDAYSDGVELFRTGGGLIKGLQRGLVVAIGGLVVLDTLGISITPILASLGIGSLAVALALQPTLENFFAGMQIVVDHPIRPGHFIKLESGEEGYVERIGWRSTWIRHPSNHMIIIPNKQMVSSRVTNYNYPSKDQAISLELGVHPGADLGKVERVTCEVGEAVMRSTEGAVADFKPFVRFQSFADSKIVLSIILRVQEVTDGGLIKHEFIKALQKRYREEGIVIPFPVQAINLKQEGADQVLASSSKSRASNGS